MRTARQPSTILQPLWPDGAPGMARGRGSCGYLRRDRAPSARHLATGTALVICPGGGYGFLAMHPEGHDVAGWLTTRSELQASCCVLVSGQSIIIPAPLHDAQRGLRVTRSHAREWGIDPARIGIMGFSAGGHLASTAGALPLRFRAIWAYRRPHRPCELPARLHDSLLSPHDSHDRASSPTSGARDNLLGSGADPKLAESLSNDTQVTAETPPTFLMHTTADTVVPPENSVQFYQALLKHKVPAELHIYEKGPHGIGMGPPGLPASTWPGACAGWMKSRGLLEGLGSDR